MKYEIYSEDTGNVLKVVEADTETAAWICRDTLIAELKSKCILGNDRLLVRLTPEDQEIAMYGCTEAQMLEQAQREHVVSDYDRAFYAVCILSDAQEMMRIDPNQARQFINKAKFFIGEVQQTLRRGKP